MKINIVCTIDDDYVEHCAAMLHSLGVNNRSFDIRVFVITCGLSNQKQQALASFLKSFCSQVEFIIADQSVLQGAPITRHVTLATYLRILIPELVSPSVDKLLFLDADIIVRRDITALWDLDVSRYSHAAAENPGIQTEHKLNLGLEEEPYFNAGVMLINVDAWRSLDVTKRALRFIREHPENIRYWDQDALNSVLRGCWRRFDLKWNAQHAIFNGGTAELLGVKREEFDEATSDPVVLHFSGAGPCKPWHYRCSHPFRDEYRRYRSQTPWPKFQLVGKARLSRRLYSQARRWISGALG